MFTGLIESVQPVQSIKSTSTGKRIGLRLGQLAQDAQIGDSICVNGICLTINEIKGDQALFDIMAETLRAGTLGSLKVGSRVNLERALTANGRLGGHIVQGHVDGIGRVDRIDRASGQWILWISTNVDLMGLMIPKGSVAIDGVSLTIVEIESRRFSTSLIPTTLNDTNLCHLRVNDKVNLEADIIGKWIKKRLDEILPNYQGNISIEKLREQGFV